MSSFVPLTFRDMGPAFPRHGDTVDPAYLPAATTFERVAAQALGGHRAVVALGNGDVGYASAGDPAHFGRVIGITTGAADADAPVRVQSHGPLTEPSWSWLIDLDIWLADNGLLTQTPPSAGFAQRLGFALAPDRIWVELSEPVFF